MKSSTHLDHVLWLGGSACAGKTSVARRLAQRYGLPTYHCDEHYDDHKTRVEPRGHPHFHALMQRSPEELWTRPAAEQAEELVGFYAEELDMVVDDLRVRPSSPLLVEGAGLLPECLTKLVADPRRALWLVSSPGLRRRRYPERGAWVGELLAQCRDPEAAWRRWMERDDLYAAHLTAEAQRANARVVEIDGDHGLDEVVARVEEIWQDVLPVRTEAM